LDLKEDEEDLEVFSVNLVRPAVSQAADKVWMPTDLGARHEIHWSDQLLANFGPLLFPWEWADVKWQPFGRFAAEPWKPIPTGVNLYLRPGCTAPTTPTQTNLHKWTKQYIVGRVKESKHVFSGDPEDLEARVAEGATIKQQSLPAAMAPLTHLPAPLSNATLGLAGFLAIPTAKLNEFDDANRPAGEEGDLQIVCFPHFTAGGTALKPDLAEVEAGVSGRLGISYDEEIAETPVWFWSNVVERGDPAPTFTGGLNTLDDGAELLLELAAEDLAPLRVVSNVVTAVLPGGKDGDGQRDASRLALLERLEDESTRKAWMKALVAGMGVGFERTRKASEKEEWHLFEFASSREDLTTLFPTDEFGHKGLHTAAAVVQAAAPEEVLAAFAASLRGEAREMLEDPLARVLSASDSEEFLAGWMSVVDHFVNPSTRADAYSRWWQSILQQMKPENAGEAAKAALESLQDELNRIATAGVLVRARLGVLDRITVHGEPGPWKVLNELLKNPGDPDAIGAVRDWIIEGIINPALGELPQTDEIGKKIVTDLIEAYGAQHNTEQARARDGGLEIALEAGSGTTGQRTTVDQRLRGFCVCLKAGLLDPDVGEPFWDDERAAWITDRTAEVRYSEDDGASYKSAKIKDNEGFYPLHETIGSVTIGGTRQIRLEYWGDPITAALADAEEEEAFRADLFQDFFDEASQPMPLLGFGLHYVGERVALDNAGGVIQDKRSGFATLQSPTDAITNTSPRIGPYLSCDPPGAPRVDLVDVVGTPEGPKKERWLQARWWEQLHSLSSETRTNVFRAQEGGGRTRPVSVALLADPDAKVSVTVDDVTKDRKLFEWASGVEFKVRPPIADLDFVRRWHTTDRLILEKKPDAKQLLTDPVLEGQTHTALQAFVDGLDGGKRGVEYDPVVSAIGVAVWVNDVVGAEDTHHKLVWPIDRLTVDDGGAISANTPELRLSVKVGAAFEFERDGDGAAITLPAGWFARVGVFSLVDETLFIPQGAHTSSRQRYGRIEGALAFHDSDTGTEYRGFGPVERWFEVAPEWDDEMEPNIALTFHPPNENRPYESTAQVEVDRADWVRDVVFQRHAWHWTGLPLDLPDPGKDLKEWVAAFATVESFREAGQHTLTTFVKPGGQPLQWRSGTSSATADVIHRQRLGSGRRPSRFGPYVARFAVRFRAALSDELLGAGPFAIEDSVHADGGFIPGIAPDPRTERLTSRPIHASVPLTRTYEPSRDGGLPTRVANGNMLVIDSPIRVTHDLAREGGMGEVIDVDLVHTREVLPGKQFREIGRVPSLHATPDPDDNADLSLTVSPPFGLTRDLVRNALVSQTAMIVEPEGGHGAWMMAKVRTRRLVLPETMLRNVLEPKGDGWIVPHRTEADEAIPIDFAVDFAGSAWPPSMTLETGGGSRSIELPDPPGEEGARRLLCTWHKARWKQNEDPRWRIQVMAQRRVPGAMRWETKGTKSPHLQSDWDPPPGTTTSLLKVDALPTFVRSVGVSDYTPAEWLTFIGSFGKPRLGRDDQYRLISRGGGGARRLTLEAIDKVPMPGLSRAPAPEDWKDSDDLVFQFLFVHEPVASIVRGDLDESTGRLLAVFQPTEADKSVFEPLGPSGEIGNLASVSSLAGCWAMLKSFRRIYTGQSALSVEEIERRKLDTFAKIEEAIFGVRKISEDPTVIESLISPLPEEIGPIRVVDEN